MTGLKRWLVNIVWVMVWAVLFFTAEGSINFTLAIVTAVTVGLIGVIITLRTEQENLNRADKRAETDGTNKT